MTEHTSHCLAHVFSQEVTRHNRTASWTPLAASSRVHPVPVMCPGTAQRQLT